MKTSENVIVKGIIVYTITLFIALAILFILGDFFYEAGYKKGITACKIYDDGFGINLYEDGFRSGYRACEENKPMKVTYNFSVKINVTG